MKKGWIFLALISGLLSEDFGVTFENQCALEGETLHVKCQYHYPLYQKVISIQWFKIRKVFSSFRLVPVFNLGHFENVGDRMGNCSLRINNIKHADEGNYYFYFKTAVHQKLSKNALHLSVKDLTASVEPNTVTEGGNVTLTCSSGCDTVKILWYRDGNLVGQNHSVFQADRNDSGRYHCAVFGQDEITSASVTLNVQYPPSNIEFSMTPPEDISNGSSLILSCSSDANPQVSQNGYRLYKDNQLINSGPNHIIFFPQPGDSGQYHCQASNNISTLPGIPFVKSTEFNLNVQYMPSEVSSVDVMCNSTADPVNHSYMWYKWISSNSLLYLGSGQMLSLPSMETPLGGIYLCQARSQYKVVNSTTVLLLMESQHLGHVTVGLLGGFGGGLFLILLLFLWKKHRESRQKEIKQVSSAPNEDQPNSIYANVNMVVPSPQSLARKYSQEQHANVMHSYGHVKTRRQLSNPQSHTNQQSISNDDDVTYTAVTSEVKKTHLDLTGPQVLRFKVGETADSVTYSTLAT
ncbi:B-cell receptor CD22-like [Stigmatopora nigra]